MKKRFFLMGSLFLTMAAIVGCSSEDDAVNPSPSPSDPTQTVTKVSIIDPIGYAQNLGAWMPASATNKYKRLLVEEGQHYLLGVICEPSTVKNPIIDWNFANSQFEEANISEQGIVTGVAADPNNTNQCLIVATTDNNVSDTIEVCVLKELSVVTDLKNDNPDIVIIDGASKRSTAYVSAINASGTLNNRDLITGFFSDKNRANFNDAATITFNSGTSFDIQGNGVGVNILMTYSKAYSTTSAGTVYFDNVRDYTVLTSTSRRQALMVDSSYVSLNDHNQHMATGETYNLSATLTAMSPLKQVPVKYASSNPAVATVDANGKVTAVSRGFATVTAYTNHLAESQYCVVNVDDAVPVAVTRIIDVNDPTTAHTVSRALLVKGQTKQLYDDSHKDEMTAASGTEWRSSDESIVTVDASGKVTAVAPGTAVIYNTPFMEANGVKEYGIADCSCITVMPDYRTAQLGDIFYEDGSFSPTPLLGKKAIGIIAYLNCDTNGNPAVGTNELCESGETGQYGAIDAAQNFHGLVMALNNANASTEEVFWGAEAKQTGLVGVTIASGNNTDPNNTTPIEGTASNMSGYNAAIYTNAMHVVDGSQTFVPSIAYPASYKAWNYNVSVPSFCTGWFLPSAPQWYAVLTKGLGGLGTTTLAWNTSFDSGNTAFTKINAKLSGVSGDQLPTSTNALIWTSNESSTTGDKATVLIKDASGLKFTEQTKTAAVGVPHTIVRPFFAF